MARVQEGVPAAFAGLQFDEFDCRRTYVEPDDALFLS